MATLLSRNFSDIYNILFFKLDGRFVLLILLFKNKKPKNFKASLSLFIIPLGRSKAFAKIAAVDVGWAEESSAGPPWPPRDMSNCC